MTGFLRIGDFRLDVASGNLEGDGEPARLSPKSTDVLLCLALQPGRVVSREELHDQVWTGQYVTDSQVSKAVNELRTAFGDQQEPRRYIETLPRRGYRLVAAVEEVAGPQTPAEGSTARADAPSPDEPAPSSRRTYPGAITAVACLVVVLAIAVWQMESVETAEEMPVLQIQHFDDLSADGSLGWLSGGMAEALAFYLTLVDGVVVRTPPFPTDASSSFSSSELVLSGSVQREADTVQVTAKLSSLSDGELIWSGIYPRDLVDLFDVQRTIAWEIVEAIEASVGMPVSPGMDIVMKEARYGAADVRAYEYYRKALDIKMVAPSLTAQQLESALALNRKAVEIDPSYSMGFVGLGATHQALWYRYRKPLDRRAAIDAYDRAIALDETNPIARGNRATMATEDKHWRESIALVEGANHWTEVLDVSRAAAAYLVALVNAGEWERAQQRLDELVLFVERNPARFPPSSSIHVEIGFAMDILRRPAQVIIEHLEPVLAFQTFWKGAVQNLLSQAYFDAGQEDAALQHLTGSLSAARAEAARLAYARGGRMEVYRALLELDGADGQPCRQWNARLLAMLQERDRMLACIEEQRPMILDLRWSTTSFDRYRNDPQFLAELEARGITVHPGWRDSAP